MRSKWIVVAAALALPQVAYAFADATQFFNSAPHAATFGASGEGLYFTGAPRYASLDCSSCHLGGPQQVGLRLNADDTTLFTNGYVPGHTYMLQVELTNEGQGLKYRGQTCTDPPTSTDTFPYMQCNNNSFGLEIDSASGPLSGVYCAQNPAKGGCPMPDYQSDESLVAPDDDAVFGSKIYSKDPNLPKTIVNNGATSWRLWWTAPKAGTGALTVYVAAVDGNGGAGVKENDQDPYGDDTVSANFFLQEANAGVDNAAHAGCDVTGARAAVPATAWWGLVALLVGRGLARRRALALARCRNVPQSSSSIAPR